MLFLLQEGFVLVVQFLGFYALGFQLLEVLLLELYVGVEVYGSAGQCEFGFLCRVVRFGCPSIHFSICPLLFLLSGKLFLISSIGKYQNFIFLHNLSFFHSQKTNTHI